MATNRVFVLGIDGGMLEFINRSELPTFQELVHASASGTLFSRPALTPAAWTSMVTGQNPGKHGIFDFRIGEELYFSTHKKSAELWDFVPSIVINVPMTYPVKPINGVMIAGMLSPDLESDLVYPEPERAYLKKLDYIIEPKISLESVQDSIEKRIELIKHYFDYEWQLFFVVFREFDVIHHFFWGQDLPYYQMLDRFLGDFLLPRLKQQDIKLAIVSDHGFAPVIKAVNIQRLIEELGYAQDYQVGGWGALYLKQEVSQSRNLAVKRAEIIERLKNYQVAGEKILAVYPDEEIFWGPYASQGPDLLVWPKRELGYTFKMRSEQVISSALPKTGCHLESGLVLLYSGKGNRQTIKADIKDIFPTVMSVLGEEVPSVNDGKMINWPA